jgi:hypothetical protein
VSQALRSFACRTWTGSSWAISVDASRVLKK